MGFEYIQPQFSGSGGTSENVTIQNVPCNSNVSVGDVVLMNGSGMAIRAIANAFSNGNLMGVAYSKSSSTVCSILLFGLTPAIYTGLVENSLYYLSDSTLGAMTTIAPVAIGSTIVIVGQAFSTTRLVVRKQIILLARS